MINGLNVSETILILLMKLIKQHKVFTHKGLLRHRKKVMKLE